MARIAGEIMATAACWERSGQEPTAAQWDEISCVGAAVAVSDNAFAARAGEHRADHDASKIAHLYRSTMNV